MRDCVLYVHGKGGSAEESAHYRPLFPEKEVIGMDYRSSVPWEAGAEICAAVKAFHTEFRNIALIANSIGAYFCMNAGIDTMIRKAYFISPIVDMERLILGMMADAKVTEARLQAERLIRLSSGEALSWEYLTFVREHPLRWTAPTEILYGEKDALTSYETIAAFSAAHNARLTVMQGGEHWFHSEEQMRFLDGWIEGVKT